MRDKLKRLLAAVKAKQARAGGIGLALWYAKSIADVVPDQKSAERYFGPGGRFVFDQSIKEAGRKLVFRNADMKILGGRWAAKSDSLFGEPEEKARKSFLKAIKEAKGGGDLKACMHFEAVYTSKKRDRDGDILEPKGAEIDSGMPLLWQHNAAQPIGRHMAITGKDEDQIKGHCAIADTELGRDAACLVEFGALRISHGFAPKEYEPLSEEESKGKPGWHVKAYEMMEVSLVSIPSNTDAVITAFGRSKLHCPLVKAWAKRLHDVRATLVKGGFDKNGKNKAGGSGTGGKSGASSNVTLNLNLDGGLKGLLESLEKKAGKKKAGKKAEGDNEEEGEKDEGEEGDDEQGEKTLLEQVREQLQALAASGELSDETLAKVNAMVITVSEAIGAERAGGSAPAQEESEEIEWESSEEEEEDKDEEEEDDKDEEEEDDDKEGDDEEEEKRDDQNEDDLDGEDMEDPSVTGKPPKSFTTADDAAAFLLLMLGAGKKVKKSRLSQLLDAVSRAIASA